MPSPIYGNFPLYIDPRSSGGAAFPFGFQYGNTFPGWGNGFLPLQPQKQKNFFSRFFTTVLPITAGVSILGILLGRRKSKPKLPSTPPQPAPSQGATEPTQKPLTTGPIINGQNGKYAPNTPGGYGGNAFSNYNALLDNPTLENLTLANEATLQYSEKPLPGILQNIHKPRFQQGLADLRKGAQEDFNRFDLNHDGAISRDELVAKNFQGALQTLQLQGVNPFLDNAKLKETLQLAQQEADLTLQTEDFVRTADGKTDGKITLDEHTATILTQDAGIQKPLERFQPDGQITQQELADFRNKQLSENGIAEIQSTLNVVHRLYDLAGKTDTSTPPSDRFQGIDGAQGPFGDNTLGSYGRNAFLNYKNAATSDQPVRYSPGNNPEENRQNLLGYAREYIKTVDTNNSKTITPDELIANFEKKFIQQKGLNPSQARQAATQAAALFFNVANLNGDQQISLDEMAATFILQDAGGLSGISQEGPKLDGILTSEEYKGYEASVQNNPAQTQAALKSIQQRFQLSQAAQSFLQSEGN